MKNEGGRMKEKRRGMKSIFILHPSSLILSLKGDIYVI